MDTVRAILGRACPDSEVVDLAPIGRGNRKETVLATFADGERVVVQHGPDPAAVRTEATLARAVRERTGVPVPRIRATGRIDGRGYIVADHAAGEDLHERFVDLSPENQRRVARAFGRALGELHDAFAFDGYGAVEAAEAEDGPILSATGGSEWPPWFEEYARAGVVALPAAFDALREDLLAAVESADIPASPPSTLYPWDLRPGNALVADGDVTAVVDWGEPLAAPAGLGLAKVEHLVADWYVEDGGPLRAALREGYESVRPLPAVPSVYRVVAVVRSAVDGEGAVTRPRYPELTGEDAVAFHRERLAAALGGSGDSDSTV